jgi:hypothetical protein
LKGRKELLIESKGSVQDGKIELRLGDEPIHLDARMSFKW